MALNEKGVVAVSRSVVLDPPPREDVPYYQQDMGGSSSDALSGRGPHRPGGIVAGLEVVLLAGAAFAVGARRQARSLAVVAASGGEGRHARSIVLAGGLVLGAVGGIAGTVLGIGLTRVSLPLLQRLTGTELGRFDVRPVEVLGIASLGVLVGVAAALLPARAASRMDVVAALAGRRGAVRTPRKVPAIGVLVVAAGVAASVVGSGLALALSRGERESTDTMQTVAAALIAGGAGLTMLGLIVTSPAIVGAAGRLAASCR
jgi:putative ABC transport system permease protein